jgi:hypothetical protein
VRPGSHYYVFTWRDPRPFFTDLAHMLGKALGRGSHEAESAAEPGQNPSKEAAVSGALP